jgi:DNA replication protein DnaC
MIDTETLPEFHAVLPPGVPRYKPPDKYRSRDEIEPAVRERINALACGQKPWPMTIIGEQGSGKTCILLCMVDVFGGWYLELPQLLKMLIAAQKGELATQAGYKRTETEIWRDIDTSMFVALDELGQREGVSDFHYEVLKGILDRREGKALAIASNLDVGELAGRYDDRIASRLSAGTIVRTIGDRRVTRSCP